MTVNDHQVADFYANADERINDSNSNNRRKLLTLNLLGRVDGSGKFNGLQSVGRHHQLGCREICLVFYQHSDRTCPRAIW